MGRVTLCGCGRYMYDHEYVCPDCAAELESQPSEKLQKEEIDEILKRIRLEDDRRTFIVDLQKENAKLREANEALLKEVMRLRTAHILNMD